NSPIDPCSVLPGSASTPIIRLSDLRGATGQLGLTLVEHSVQTKTDIEQLPGRVDGILHIANKTKPTPCRGDQGGIRCTRARYQLLPVCGRKSVVNGGIWRGRIARPSGCSPRGPHTAWSKARRPSDRVGRCFRTPS